MQERFIYGHYVGLKIIKILINGSLIYKKFTRKILILLVPYRKFIDAIRKLQSYTFFHIQDTFYIIYLYTNNSFCV